MEALVSLKAPQVGLRVWKRRGVKERKQHEAEISNSQADRCVSKLDRVLTLFKSNLKSYSNNRLTRFWDLFACTEPGLLASLPSAP